MITSEIVQSEILAYWFTVLFVFIILGRYGRQAMEWILMKLFELFIQRNPMKL